MLVSVFFFKSPAQILLKLLFLSDMAFVGLQVRKCLMQLRHKHLIVGFAEVGVIVSTELVVAVDHVADRAHHPLDRVHGTNSVGITVHHGDWCLANVLNRNVSSCAMLFSLQVRVHFSLQVQRHLSPKCPRALLEIFSNDPICPSNIFQILA